MCSNEVEDEYHFVIKCPYKMISEDALESFTAMTIKSFNTLFLHYKINEMFNPKPSKPNKTKKERNTMYSAC